MKRNASRRGSAFVTGLLASLLLSCGSMAWADPEDDFRGGSQAYRMGDVVQAMVLLKRSADAGHARSQSLLAYILDKAEFNEEAVAYYRKAAAQGNADGEFGLGSMYAAGEGVPRDYPEARKLITRAAEKGHAGATNLLAQAYLGGELGIDERQRRGAEALRWITRASEGGFLPAMERLAQAYRTGGYGLAIDLKLAEALEGKIKAARGVAARAESKGARKK